MKLKVLKAVLYLNIMPSRAVMSAGLALEKDNVAGFNCSYVAVDNVRAIDEHFTYLCVVLVLVLVQTSVYKQIQIFQKICSLQIPLLK